MSLNPRRYDVRELRRIADTPRDGADEAPRERALRQPNRNQAEQAARSAAFTELLQRQRGLRLSRADRRPETPVTARTLERYRPRRTRNTRSTSGSAISSTSAAACGAATRCRTTPNSAGFPPRRSTPSSAAWKGSTRRATIGRSPLQTIGSASSPSSGSLRVRVRTNE